MTDQADPIPRIGAADAAAHSGDITAENIAALKALFPAIVSDGRIDFDVLRQVLGDQVEDGEERYGLNWKGKRAARAFALTPSMGTLRPAELESEAWNTTQNIVIEGDNLEALKLLRRSYAGKVKLIYIDPPYNTGNDFVYPDDYRDSLGNYEALTGQRGADGARTTTNKEASGRFHTDWLNMIYPRLMLAKDLLREDGLLFVSVDATELMNCKQILESVFGVERLFGVVSRVTGTPTGGGNKALVGEVDYLLIFGGGSESQLEGATFSEKDAAIYDREDENGKYLTRSLRRTGGEDRREDRPTMYYPIDVPDGSVVYPIGPTGYESRWICSEPRYLQMKEEGLIELIRREKNGTAEYQVHQKFYLEGRTKQPSDFWSNIEGNKKATRDLKALFDTEKVFSNPKPVGLLRHIIEISETIQNDLILDFFAGSGTTGHAVMAQNVADGGTRRYILVQLPEPLDPANAAQKTAADFCDTLGVPRTIAELTKERLRRAGAKLKAEHPDAVLDTGFRVYKLATSNLKPWNPPVDASEDELRLALEEAVDNVLPGRSEDDLLAELLLKTGIDLTLASETKVIAGATVHALGGGTLIVCLSPVGDNAQDLGEGIADWRVALDPAGSTTFYFRDSGFASASAKANLAAILKQRVGRENIAKLASL